jgi:ligand-binding sensor domain-containing protein/class 3 adenylate cyclase
MRHAAGLALLSLAAVPACQAQQYDLRNYSLEQGLPSSVVNALCEDADGFLWVGTGQGAARTDGLRFEAFGREQGLPHEQVTALAAGADGAVWMGFGNGTLARWRHGRITTVRATPGAAVRALALHGDAVWWATSGQGVWRLQQGQEHRYGRADGLLSEQVFALSLDAQGRPVAGTDSGLFALREGRWQAVAPFALPHRRVNALHADADGFVAATPQGFLELDTALSTLAPELRFMGSFPIALPEPNLQAVLRARNGDLWFGTLSGLLHLTKVNGQPTLTVMREANGLGNDLVRCLAQDRSGAIWIGTGFGGLSKYTSGAFLHFTDRDGLGSRTVSAVHRTPDGRLWMGTAGGGLASWDGRQLRTYGAEDGLNDPFVIALGEDAEGYLLAGTAANGLFRYDERRFQRLAQGLDGQRVHAIHLDAQGRNWVGTERGLHCDPGKGAYMRVAGCAAPVAGIASSGDSIWACTAEGLFALDARQAPLRLAPVRALPAHSMTCIARDTPGNLWIGTESHGLLRLHGTRADSIQAADGLGSNAVEQVLLDGLENVWVGTRRGVSMLELDALQERVLRVRHYSTEDGFIGAECFRNACLLDTDSALWFGTVRGATRHDPRRAIAEEPEPRVHITGLRLFFERPDWRPWSTGIDSAGLPVDLRLPHDRNHLTFSFTGISLAFPEKVRYRYLLEGHDPDWSPITATDSVTYSNLPPGDYAFKVMARNASGIWNEEPVAFAFRIEAPFWQTSAFRGASGLALLLGFYGFTRMRTRRLQRERERLERTVQERTRELAQEKDRSEELLRNILPAATADELKAKGHADARRYERCTVLFSDFKGFTAFSSRMDSATLVSELHHYFSQFDQLCARHGLEKIKTIGDAYMCAAGLPEPSPTHALDALLMAFGMLDAVERSNAERRAKGLQEWPIRIGLHSGPVVAGVVGTRKFAYDIWGDTVNLASRMEANGDAGRVNISGPVYAQVMDYIEAQPRGPIKVKGKGEVQMYFALRLKAMYSADAMGWLPNAALRQAAQG